MFDIDIPEVDDYERGIDDILRHLAECVAVNSRIGYGKQAKEATDMVIAFINKELSYSDALQNIHEIGEGLGMKGIFLGSIVVDLNDAMEVMNA